jgi:hypothetical protein
MKKPLALLGLMCVLSSCRPFALLTVDPSGTPEYQLGWEDGCDSGLSAEGNWTYKLMYGFKKRTEMAANDQYKQGWNEGFSYCRFSLAASSGPSEWRDVGMGDGF